MPKEIFVPADKKENKNSDDPIEENLEENESEEPKDPKEIAAQMIEDLYYPKAGEMKEERKENIAKEILERVETFKEKAEQKIRGLNIDIKASERDLEAPLLERMPIPKRVFEKDILRSESIIEIVKSEIEKYNEVEQSVQKKEFEIAITSLEGVTKDLLKENRILDSKFEFIALFNNGGSATGDSIYENEREMRKINQSIGQLEKLIEEK